MEVFENWATVTQFSVAFKTGGFAEKMGSSIIIHNPEVEKS